MRRTTEKKLQLTMVVAAVAAMTPLAAQAGDGWYLGAEGGFNFLDKQHFKIYHPEGGGIVPDGSTIGQVKLKDGWLGGLVFGYAMENGLRPELEYAYRENNLKSVHVEPVGLLGGLLNPQGTDADGVRGDENVHTLMANLWFDLFKKSSIHPYIGGGIGAARVAMHGGGYDDQDFFNDEDYVFAYQLGAGIGLDLGDHWTVSVDYRWLDTNRPKLNLLHDSPPTRVKFDYEAQSMILGVRYSFGGKQHDAPPPLEPPVAVVPVEEPPPAPEPPPLPPAPPCQGPVAGQAFSLAGCKTGDTVVLHGVNFNFDKSTLTANAKVILDQVVEALTARPDIQVEIDGHTDSKGSDAYNQKLSERRAAAVQQYLVQHGITASRLRSAGFGESVPVGDNATDEGREQNRRVELKVTGSDPGAPPVQ